MNSSFPDRESQPPSAFSYQWGVSDDFTNKYYIKIIQVWSHWKSRKLQQVVSWFQVCSTRCRVMLFVWVFFDVKERCTSSKKANFVPKIFTVGGHLTEFSDKHNFAHFLGHNVYSGNIMFMRESDVFLCADRVHGCSDVCAFSSDGSWSVVLHFSLYLIFLVM